MGKRLIQDLVATIFVMPIACDKNLLHIFLSESLCQRNAISSLHRKIQQNNSLVRTIDILQQAKGIQIIS